MWNGVSAESVVLVDCGVVIVGDSVIISVSVIDYIIGVVIDRCSVVIVCRICRSIGCCISLCSIGCCISF